MELRFILKAIAVLVLVLGVLFVGIRAAWCIADTVKNKRK